MSEYPHLKEPRASGPWRTRRDIRNAHIDKRGYVIYPQWLLSSEGLLMAKSMSKRGEVLEHRLVMALALGRPLTRYERVYHRNGKKSDNDLRNLVLVVGRGTSRQTFALVRRADDLGYLEQEVSKTVDAITRAAPPAAQGGARDDLLPPPNPR